MSAMNDMLESEFRLKQENQSLRQQLAAVEHDRDNLLNQNVMLRKAIEKYLLESDHHSDSHVQFYAEMLEALAYTEAELGGLILCEREPHYLVEDVTENGKNVFNAYRAARRPE